MIVKVIKTDLSTHWYSDKVGYLFEVIDYDNRHYKVIFNGELTSKLLDKEDVEIVEIEKDDLIKRLKQRWDRHFERRLSLTKELDDLPKERLISGAGLVLLKEIHEISGRMLELETIMSYLEGTQNWLL